MSAKLPGLYKEIAISLDELDTNGELSKIFKKECVNDSYKIDKIKSELSSNNNDIKTLSLMKIFDGKSEQEKLKIYNIIIDCYKKLSNVNNNNTESKDNSKPRYATITRAELAGGYFNKHVTFVILTPNGKTIKRRYTDFEWLRSKLLVLFPCSFIPPIPPKLPVAMWPTGYLLMRKRELQQFLQRLEVIKYLKECDIVKYFLIDHSNSFDKAKKKFTKENPKPSNNEIFNGLIKIFPQIHEQKIPNDIDKRLDDAKELTKNSIKQYDILCKTAKEYSNHNENLLKIMNEFKNDFEALINIENNGLTTTNNNKYCTQNRVDISHHITQWKIFKEEEGGAIKSNLLPTLTRSLNDMKVIQEIIDTRERIEKEYNLSKDIAKKWKTAEAQENLRTNQLATKHRELQNEEDLKHLYEFCNKLALTQLSLIFNANIKRWKKNCDVFIGKHSVSLKKILGNWGNLVNKTVEQGKELFKEIPVETLNDNNDNNNNNNNSNDVETDSKNVSENTNENVKPKVDDNETGKSIEPNNENVSENVTENNDANNEDNDDAKNSNDVDTNPNDDVNNEANNDAPTETQNEPNNDASNDANNETNNNDTNDGDTNK